ncbi:MAG: hypothetical protein IJ088_10980 [Clostridia bacterium]|nr:hypothetical protein [Clostridia bacterium]
MIIYGIDKSIDEQSADVLFRSFSVRAAEKELKRLQAEDPEGIYGIFSEEVFPHKVGIKITKDMTSDEIQERLEKYYLLELLVVVDGKYMTLYEAKKLGVDTSEFEAEIGYTDD